MKTVAGFRLRKLGNEYVLIGETLELINFNKMITLNETAAFLWQQAEQLPDFNTEMLCRALCAEYDVTPEQAMTDITNTIAMWREAGVLVD